MARTRRRSKRQKKNASDVPSDDMSGGVATASGNKRGFLDLPAAIRMMVYQHIFPSGRMFTYIHRTIDSDRNITWQLILNEASPSGWREFADQEFIGRGLPGAGLLQVCKEISSEARAVINGSNIFFFDTAPILRASHVLGPYGIPEHLPLLRHMRNIRIDIHVDTRITVHEHDHWNQIAKQNLEHIVKMFKQYSNDQASQQPLLEYLHVHFRHCPKLQEIEDPEVDPNANIDPDVDPDDVIYISYCYCRESISKALFSLEHLEELRGINGVNVTGIDGWFGWYARCIELWLQGEGGEVEEMEWPMVRVKQRRYGRDPTWMKRPAKTKWYQPKFDWRKFARRNGIELPADADELFTLTTVTPR